MRIDRRLRWIVVSVTSVIALAAPATALAGSNPAFAGSVSDPFNLSGVTAVAVSGNYAYASVYYSGTLAAIDITNPAQPVLAGQSAPTSRLLNASTVNIAGGYAYVVSKNRNGSSGNDDGTGNSLTILDVSTNPAQPTIVGSIRDAVNLFGAYGVAVSGHYAFVAAQGCLTNQPCPNPTAGNSFAVIDVANPSSPAIVATLKNNSLPAPWTGTGALSHACSVAVSGNYAYVTAAYSNRLTVIDISNPLSPKIVASLPDTSQLDFPVDVAVSGGYAYVADQGTALGRLAVVDVHDPIHPQITGLVTSASTLLNGAYRVRLRGNFAYVSAITASAVSAVDISNPSAPRFAGGFSTTSFLNRTTGLDVDSSGRYLVATSPYLSSQTQPLVPPYPFQPGGPTLTGTVSTVDLEPVPIAVTISPSSKPANPTTQNSASFTFSTSDAVASLQCQLDGAPLGLCTSATTQNFSSLSLGSHTFAVQATDAAGHTATDSYTWTINPATLPANVSPPTVSGSAVQGQVLSASPGSWSGSPAPTFTYQWQRCDSNGANCVAIVPATSPSYTLTSADIDSTVLVLVTATNSAGQAGPVASGASAVVAPPSPLAPVTPVLDNFNRANGPAGANWALIRPTGFSALAVSGNLAVNTSSTVFSWNYWTAATFGPDSEAYVTIASYGASDTIRIGARVGGAGTTSHNGYYVSVAATGAWSIMRVDNGAPAVTLASGVTQTLAAGDKVAIRIVGPLVTALHFTNAGGWVQVLSYDTTPDSIRYTAAGRIALEFKTSSLDEFGGGTMPAGSAPVNTSVPTIAGSPVQGQVLTAAPGSWSASPAPTFTYQWQRCDSAGANCVSIVSATSSNYLLTPTDVGSTLVVLVTATNSAGQGGPVASVATAVVAPPPSAPVNTSVPTIAGSAVQGQVLTATPGSWSGSPAPTYTYQWQRCDNAGANCVSLTGETAATYTLVANDVGSTLLVLVTATNSAGQGGPVASAASAVVAPLASAPVNTSPPTVSGSTVQGQVLSASPGSWSGSPAPTFTYQWQRCDSGGANCVSLVGQTATTYTLVANDVGSTLVVLVTATNSAGQAGPVASAASAVVGAASSAPANTSPPTVSGSTVQGQVLSASPGSWSGSPAPTFTYQWQRCDNTGANCVSILGETAATYLLVPGDVGSTFRVLVTATNSAGQGGPVASAASAVVTAAATAPVNTSPPTVSGSTVQGQVLSASPGSWSGSPVPTFTYQWQRCDNAGANCVSLAGETAATYTLVGNDVGSTLLVLVTATNSAGQGGPVASAASAVVTAPATAPANTSPPTVSGSTVQGQVLSASPGSWSGSPAPTFTYQWQRCDNTGANCVSIVSATSSSYTLTPADVGSTLLVLVTATNSAGQAGPVASAASAVVTAPATAPANTSPPTVSGSTVQGQVLSASPGSWSGSPAPTFTYQWQRCDNTGANCFSIVSATSSSYTLTSADVGSTLVVLVTATNSAGQAGPVASAASAVVTAPVSAPVNTSPPTVSGSAVQGQVLSASPGSWSGSPAPTFTYQWQRCDNTGANCVSIVTATTSSYTLTSADVGSTVLVLVTATNTAGQAGPVASAASAVVSAPSLAPVTPVLDNFNRANGPVGTNWGLIRPTGFSALAVSGNTAVNTSGTLFAWDYWKGGTFGPDCEAYATIATYGASDVIRIGARVSGAGTTTHSGYYISVTATGAWSIVRVDNGGSPVTLASGVTQTLAAGDKLAIRIVGAVVTALHYTSGGGWVQVLSYNTTSDSIRYTAAGRIALEFKTSSLDDFGGGTA